MFLFDFLTTQHPYEKCSINYHEFNSYDFLQLSTDEQKIKYLDNCINLECEDEHDGWRPIHTICRYCSPIIIKYIIDAGVNLECENNQKWRPLHYVCRYSTPEMIKYMIGKGVNLECENENNVRPIHIIAMHSTFEILQLLVNRNIDLECESNDGWRPIHILCKYSNKEAIQYAFTKCDIRVKCLSYCDMPVDYNVFDLIRLNETINNVDEFIASLCK